MRQLIIITLAALACACDDSDPVAPKGLEPGLPEGYDPDAPGWHFIDSRGQPLAGAWVAWVKRRTGGRTSPLGTISPRQYEGDRYNPIGAPHGIVFNLSTGKMISPACTAVYLDDQCQGQPYIAPGIERPCVIDGLFYTSREGLADQVIGYTSREGRWHLDGAWVNDGAGCVPAGQALTFNPERPAEAIRLMAPRRAPRAIESALSHPPYTATLK